MKKLILFIVLLTIPLTAFSKDGSSGCGPGWYVAKDNSILSSALRITTNGILIPTVTLGMTFGTSNCTKHSIVKLEKERLKFATENYFEIAAETSKGSGKFLMAYGELMGCKSKHLVEFSRKMKRNFQKIFNDMEAKPESLIKQTYIIMLQDQSLRNACFQV